LDDRKVAVLGVVIAGVIASLVEPGIYTLGSTVIGITLLSVLYAYDSGNSRDESRLQSWVYAVAWALPIILVIGYPLNWLFFAPSCDAPPVNQVLDPCFDNPPKWRPWNRADSAFFIVWLVVSQVAYRYRRRTLGQRGEHIVLSRLTNKQILGIIGIIAALVLIVTFMWWPPFRAELVSLVLGIISSFVAWGILFHYLVPELRFASRISKVDLEKGEDSKAGHKYRFRFENAGQRKIIDIELIARVSIKGLQKDKVNARNTVYVPVSSDGGLSYRIPSLRPAKRGRAGGRKTIRLYPNSTDMLQGQYIFDEDLRKKSQRKELQLEDLLELPKDSPDARLEIHAFCYDSFSGTRKLFSTQYTAWDIREGRFEDTSLEIRESVSPADEEAEDNVTLPALT
jgi:hypothetical protein